jgi:sec-independent protein translocase protein TatA
MTFFEVQNVATPFAFIGMPGPMEMMIILGIGVLLFGKRLPEVGRSLGKGIVEFKKGVQGIEDEIDSASTATSSRSQASADDYEEATAPKFEPPAGEPTA